MRLRASIVILLVFTALGVGTLLGGYLNFPVNRPALAQKSYKEKLNRLLEFIDREYVDSVNTDSIVEMTVNDILGQLDPHSVYIPPSEQTAEVESMRGDFVGIGVNFYVYNDSVAVIKPLEGGPSEKAGILPGDRILYAGKSKLFGKKVSSDSLFSKLRGPEGSTVNLQIYRKSEKRKINIRLKRDVIPIKSVDVAVQLNPQTGYIKINRFAETTYDEFQAALTKLRNLHMNTLIIDLRDNGGGYMEVAAEIADELLPNKELIVFTKNKNGRVDKTFATDRGDFEEGKVYVLINENSASASEILAGAIQDNDRGTIVGRRSFGKGLVQREMDFSDGSAVRLTVARYYTPSGRSIQKNYSEGNEAYFNDFAKRFEHGELYAKDSIKIADTLKFKTRSGRIVYGGGGIVPDVFVPLEAAHGQESVLFLMQSAAVGHFAFEQLDRDRKAFKGLNFGQFLEKMKATDAYFTAFQKYVRENGLEINLIQNKALVKRYITAEFAQQLFDDAKYYEITLREDAMVKAVLAKEK